MKKNLVLTVVKSYSYRKVDPFFRTLRNSGYSGDIVVFYESLSPKTIRLIKRWRVTLLRFNSKPFKEKGISLMHYRFKFFHTFLKKNLRLYEKVLLCDIRDIVFQNDPFEYKGYAKINYFCESKKINDCKINKYVFLKVGGKEAVKKYGENLISCAGTTLGDSKEVLKYLDLQSKNMNKGIALDQGQHNLFFYSGKFPNSKKFLNFQGPILTLGDLENKRIKLSSKGKIVNEDGTVINVIHQYDRNPLLLRKFTLKKYYFQNLFGKKYLELKRFAKKVLFKTPLLNKYFKKKYYNPVEFK
ncbi:MAG: hypothetical protein KC516_01880 [Nanoarchaeota archaeon]|nr:hypothetical protein [Nanoarchaeota archaeon]